MASGNKALKGYVKTESMILIVILGLALGFVGGVVFSVYRTGGTAPVSAENPSASEAITPEQQQMIASLTAETRNDPKNMNAWTQLGHLYFDTGQPDKAIQAYETSLSLDANRPDVWTDLGVMYRRSGDPKKAVQAFDKALALNPDHQVALYNKGIVLMHDLQDPAGAIKAWEKLVSINPNAHTPNGEPLQKILEQMKQKVPS